MMASADDFSRAMDRAVKEGDASRRHELTEVARLPIGRRLDWLSRRVQGLRREDLDALFSPEVTVAAEKNTEGRRAGWRNAAVLFLCMTATSYVTSQYGKNDVVTELTRQNGGNIADYCRNEGRVVRIVPGHGEVELCVLKMRGAGSD